MGDSRLANTSSISVAALEAAAPLNDQGALVGVSPSSGPHTTPISRGLGPDTAAHLATQRLLSMRQVTALTTYSRPSIYRLVAAGQFPRPLKLGQTKIAFREFEVLDWLNSRRRA
jgi:predicted DNA-binding transcriptional regulator AlpA